ncbi:Uncharacterised protein [Mycoplasmopsis citelli]|uniref:Uncharacterized protein n=1 Tax=Mycoplasmopsis citelli TaxID=171281 RepID=A0A449B398_9BACT|nr:Uncharacterised protein [Mycoplasmopsis citelli]
MENNLDNITYWTIIIFNFYFYPRALYFYAINLNKWKFILLLINLLFLKIKNNKKSWFEDKSLKEAIFKLLGKVEYEKRVVFKNIMFDIFINCIFLYSVIIAPLFIDIKQEFFYLEYYFLIWILFSLFGIFLSVIVFYKFFQFKQKIEKFNIFNVFIIKPIKNSKNTQSSNGKELFLFFSNIFSKKINAYVLNEEKIVSFLGNDTKTIMYIYIYDISNFNAPYFVFEHKEMIKNYEGAKW